MIKSIELPGDKSISHRVAMLAAIGDGISEIENYNSGADCSSTLHCLRDLGIQIEGKIRIGPGFLKASDQPLNCGNSGSTIRMLTGLLAGQDVSAVLTGDSSLLNRPMKRVAEPLRHMGAEIELRNEEYAPIRLLHGSKHAIEYTMPVSSAQVKSAVLFAGLRFTGTSVIEQFPTRDHTERLFHHLQIIPGPSVKIPSFRYVVPGDPSSAAFLAIAALLHNQEIMLKNILLNSHRTGFLRVLERAGAPIQTVEERIQQNETVGDILVRKGNLTQPITIPADEVPGVIDEIPALTVAGIGCGFEVHGAKELRYKESDRIASMTTNLRTLGLVVDEWEDGYRVLPGKPPSAVVHTFADHRIAMAFAAAGFQIDDPKCVQISFPEFFDLLKEVGAAEARPSEF